MVSAGFSLVEVTTVIILLAILVTLAVPVFLDSTEAARRNSCRYNQRAIESALNMWKSEHADEQFITGNCLPGDGEAFLDLEGDVPGEPDRSLGPYQKQGFDCPSNGTGTGAIGSCDYITDGTAVACLTDSQVGLKADGTPFRHDEPRAVAWDHSRGAAPASAGQELGDTFQEITDGMIGLISVYYAENGSYPSSSGDAAFTDLGLNPNDWKLPYDHTYYTPAGNRVYVKPESGYVFKVKNTKGKELTLDPASGSSLIYDMKTKSWYYKNVASGQKIQIATLKIVPQ